MKNFNGTIGDQTRDLPAPSAVPQATEYRYLKKEDQSGSEQRHKAARCEHESKIRIS
jgi:hypothetical protein